MKRFQINFLTFKVTEVSKRRPLGLQFVKNKFISGFVVQADNIVDATDTLNHVEEKYRQWVSDYNTWVGLPPDEQVKWLRSKKMTATS